MPRYLHYVEGVSTDERNGRGQLPTHDRCRSGGAPVADARRKDRWKTFWEFLEEYRWEPQDIQTALLLDEPPSVGDERWDALLAALAEHLAAKHDLAPPSWAELRVLGRPWFPAELRVQRADALVHAPAAFRKHGVYLAAADLEAA